MTVTISRLKSPLKLKVEELIIINIIKDNFLMKLIIKLNTQTLIYSQKTRAVYGDGHKLIIISRSSLLYRIVKAYANNYEEQTRS